MLVAVLALHAAFALMLWNAMQLRPQHPAALLADRDQVLIVRLLDHPGTPRATPPAPPRPPASLPQQQAASPPVRPAPREKSRRDAMLVQDHQTAPAPTASVAAPANGSLFAQDGSIRLPSSLTDAPTTASAEAKPPKPADDRRIMQHDSNHMHYKATRFEKYFPPPNETAGGAVGRHIGDAIQAIAKSVCDPTKRSTASNLLCGVAPPPPSPKDGDERLNLPPPPLATDPHPARPPSLSTCIAEYNDTKPLSDGCPIDTPDLAFKAELRECIDLFRAGKRLKTWCPADTPERAAAESSTPAAAASASRH
ncbi:hypothetical protein IHE47_01100 [Rhodanobacter sp. DHB23]|nr:hypothetical protein [Rhodanobacter sp. DHB23]